MGFGSVPELQLRGCVREREVERPVAVVIVVDASTLLLHCAADSFGREEDPKLTPGNGECARGRPLSGIAVGPLPEHGIAGEAGTGGGKSSGEADVVATFAVLSLALGSLRGGATDAAPWMTSMWEQHRGRAEQDRCWRLDRGVLAGATMTSTATKAWWRRHEAEEEREGVEVGIAVVRAVS